MNTTRDAMLGFMAGMMFGWTILAGYYVPQLVSAITAVAYEIKQLDR
jgi:hypothetical protein